MAARPSRDEAFQKSRRIHYSLLLAACVIAAYLARDAGTSHIAAKRTAASSQLPLVDERLLETAPR